MAIETVGVGEIAQTSSDDRRELLAKQLDEAPAVEQVEPAPVAEPTKTEGERARSADGKFAPKVEAKPDATPEVIEEPKWKKPPQSWKKELHEHWGKTEQESVEKILQTVHEREEQMRAGIEPVRQKAQFYDQMGKTVQPYLENIRQATGGTSTEHVMKAISGLMNADHALRHSSPDQKKAYLYQLAQIYGVNLGNAQDAPVIIPQVHALQQQLNQLSQERENDKRAAEQAEAQSLLSDIEKFATTHEHFESLRPTMVKLLQSETATDLEDAYKKAIRLNDELFQAEQAASQAKAAQEKIKTKDQAAKAAKTASVSVRSSTPGTHTASQAQDRRSRLAEQFGELDDRL